MKKYIVSAILILLVSISVFYFYSQLEKSKKNTQLYKDLLEELQVDCFMLMDNSNKVVKDVYLHRETIDFRLNSELFVSRFIIKTPMQACSCYEDQIQIIDSLCKEANIIPILITSIEQYLNYRNFLKEIDSNIELYACSDAIDEELENGLRPFCFSLSKDFKIRNLFIIGHNRQFIHNYINRYIEDSRL